LKIKSSQRKSLAAIPTAFKGQERRYAQSVSESLDTLSGRRGNAIDRAVTFRDLLDSGVLKLAGGILSEGGIDLINPNDPNSDDNGPIELPTKPSNLVVSSGFESLFLDWVLPPYNGHDYIEIFRFASDSIASAEAAGAYTRYYGDQYFYVDENVGSQETWYYWVRAVNKNGVIGPFNSSSGTGATSALDYLFISGLIDDILDDDINNLGLNQTITALEDFTGYTTSYSGNSLTVRMGDVETVAGNAATSAQLQSEITTRASQDSALSSSINTLSTTVGNNTTSIQTNTSSIDGVEAKYSVKIDNNGHVSGFGLISTANNGTPFASFVVAADRFGIASTGITPAFPFKVITSQTTINGATVPAGVYIDDAFIHDAQITNATIADATITDAKITDLTATKITSGEIIIDNSNDIAIRQGKTSYSSNANGFWLGNNNGSGAFNIGNATNYLKFNGSTLQVTGASITDLSVTTLKIGPNAVTVPDGEDASGLSINVGSSFVNVDSGYNYLSDWDANSVPSSFLITGNVQFVGTNTFNQTSRPATAGIRFAWDWKTNQGTWSSAGDSQYNKTIGQQSLAQTFGGQAVSTAKIDVPSWSRGMRIRIQARNNSNYGGSGSTSRKLTGYGYFIVAAKR